MHSGNVGIEKIREWQMDTEKQEKQASYRKLEQQSMERCSYGKSYLYDKVV